MAGHENSVRLIQCEILQEEGGNPSFHTIQRKVRARTIIPDGLSEIITKLTVFGFKEFGVAWLSQLRDDIHDIGEEFVPRPPSKRKSGQKKSQLGRQQSTAGQQSDTGNTPGTEVVANKQRNVDADTSRGDLEEDRDGDVSMDRATQEVVAGTDPPPTEEVETATSSGRQHAGVGETTETNTIIDTNLSQQQLETIARSAYELSTDPTQSSQGEQSSQVQSRPPSAISAPPDPVPAPATSIDLSSDNTSQTVLNTAGRDDDQKTVLRDVRPATTTEDGSLMGATDPPRQIENPSIHKTANGTAPIVQSLQRTCLDQAILTGSRKRTFTEVVDDGQVDRCASGPDGQSKKAGQHEDPVTKVRSYRLVLAGGVPVGRDIDKCVTRIPSCPDFLRSLLAKSESDGFRFEDLAKIILQNYCNILQSSSPPGTEGSNGRRRVQAVSQPAFTLLLNVILSIFRPDTLLHRIREQLDAFRGFMQIATNQDSSTTHAQLQDLSPLLRRLSVASKWMAVSSRTGSSGPTDTVTMSQDDYVSQSGQLCQQIHSLECHTKVSGFLLAMKCFQLAEAFDKILEETQVRRDQYGTAPDLGSGQGLKTYVKHLIIKNHQGAKTDLSRDQASRRYTDPKTMEFSNKLDHYLETGRFAQEMVRLPGRDRNIGMLLLWPVKPDGSSALSGNNVKAGSRHVLRAATATVLERLPRVMDIIARLGTVVARMIELPNYPRTMIEIDDWDNLSRVANWQEAMALLQENPNSSTQPQWDVTPQKTRAGLWNSETGNVEHQADGGR